ncbi:MAG: molecular chaperone [Myxococcota bacterium]
MTTAQAERALARARVYRGLATLFRVPDSDLARRLRERDWPELRAALVDLDAGPAAQALAEQLEVRLTPSSASELSRAHRDSFGLAGDSICVPNETAHAPQTPQEALVRTFQLADIAGFYRAFGVEIVPETERVDHIVAELEFMQLLCVKQATAESHDNREAAEICAEAAAAFVEDHLGRWVSRFRARLEEIHAPELYVAAARLLEAVLELEERPSRGRAQPSGAQKGCGSSSR